MACIEHSLADDPTNWWLQSRAVMEMLLGNRFQGDGRPRTKYIREKEETEMTVKT